MKRIEFIIKHPGCVRIKIEDEAGEKNFCMETEGMDKTFSTYIYGESFKMTLTPLLPPDKKPETESNTFGEKILNKLIAASEKLAKDMYFFTECVYIIENFSDGDKLTLNQTVYSFRSNDAADELWIWTDVVLFPVEYFFYDALLNDQRISPAETNCLNRKKVLKRARLFMLMGEDGFQIISYPLQAIRNRRLSTPKKIYSTLLKFSEMDEENRVKYISDSNDIFDTAVQSSFDEAAEYFVNKK